MQISRIEIRNFRKLPHKQIEGLGPGLNVIVGDNEAGKSTVLAALRAALFERHRLTGEHARAMQPYGQALRPEVEVDFALRGEAYRLKKGFVQKPEALLIGRGQQWPNDEADEELARLLGFTQPGRGETKPEEHHGIFGLLWVEQGAAHRYPKIPGMQGHVSSALEQEIGEVTGGERGRRLLAAAEARYSLHWTKTGQPRGAGKLLQVERDKLAAECERLRQELRDLDDKVDALATVAARLDRYRADGTLEEARERLTAVEAAARSLDGLEAARRSAQVERDAARLALDGLEKQRLARTRLSEARARAEAKLQAAGATANDTRAEEMRHEALVVGADAVLARDTALEQQAIALAAAHEARERREALTDELARLEKQVETIDRAEAARQAAEVAIAEARIEPVQLEKLEKLAEALAMARHRLAAASVRLTLMPEAGATLRLDGTTEPAGEVMLSRDAVLEIAGYGRIAVHPGGGVGTLRDQVAVAERRFADALGVLGVADLEGARRRLEQRQQAEADRGQQRKLLETLAPEGVASLRERLGRLRAELAALPAADGEQNGTLAESRRARDSATAARGSAERAVSLARERLGQARTAAALAAQVARQAHDELERLRAESAALDLGRSDAKLEAERTTAVATLAAAEAQLAAAELALQQADPEATRLDLARKRGAVQIVEADIRKLEAERLQLEGGLNALGQRGLGEHLGQREGELARVERQLATELHEAQAARLLFETLASAQKESKERWLAPVKAAVTPYLRMLAPDGSVVLDEDTLELSEVVRNGVSEPFANLSMGAREQVAVVTRLALADLLREAGQPSTVLLDDALVNTDAERLDRMHLVLHKAAQKQQIIILTCRESDFLGLGAPIFRL
jgi:DNA repair exonuclease SbcCD ATPase subunit